MNIKKLIVNSCLLFIALANYNTGAMAARDLLKAASAAANVAPNADLLKKMRLTGPEAREICKKALKSGTSNMGGQSLAGASMDLAQKVGTVISLYEMIKDGYKLTHYIKSYFWQTEEEKIEKAANQLRLKVMIRDAEVQLKNLELKEKELKALEDAANQKANQGVQAAVR